MRSEFCQKEKKREREMDRPENGSHQSMSKCGLSIATTLQIIEPLKLKFRRTIQWRRLSKENPHIPRHLFRERHFKFLGCNRLYLIELGQGYQNKNVHSAVSTDSSHS